MRDAGSLRASDFETTMGSSFEVVDVDGRTVVSLSLVGVVRRPERPGEREPFSIYWTGPRGAHPSPVLTHHLTHPELGEIEIFLGPVANQWSRGDLPRPSSARDGPPAPLGRSSPPRYR